MYPNFEKRMPCFPSPHHPFRKASIGLDPALAIDLLGVCVIPELSASSTHIPPFNKYTDQALLQVDLSPLKSQLIFNPMSNKEQRRCSLSCSKASYGSERHADICIS